MKSTVVSTDCVKLIARIFEGQAEHTLRPKTHGVLLFSAFPSNLCPSAIQPQLKAELLSIFRLNCCLNSWVFLWHSVFELKESLIIKIFIKKKWLGHNIFFLLFNCLFATVLTLMFCSVEDKFKIFKHLKCSSVHEMSYNIDLSRIDTNILWSKFNIHVNSFNKKSLKVFYLS